MVHGVFDNRFARNVVIFGINWDFVFSILKSFTKNKMREITLNGVAYKFSIT